MKDKKPKQPIQETESGAAAPAAAGKLKKRRAFQKRKFKHGAYAIAATAAFIVVVIGLNIVATVLAERFPLQLDLTADKSYTITEENKEYIQKLDRDVTITLCADENDYTEGTYFQYLSGIYSQVMGIYLSDASGGVFFRQTVFLLKEYDKLSEHIKFQAVDPQDPSFNQFTQAYPNEEFSIGDVLIESNFELDGETVKRHRRLTVEDLYTLETSSYSYSISASKVESAVTSAIYSATADKNYQVALLTANGGNSVNTLVSAMTPNNYEFTVIDNLLTTDIPEDTDLVIVSAPTRDYTGEELLKLENFLDLKGKRGKTIMYIADDSQPVLPNLRDFLAEWGFSVKQGLVYETDTNHYMPLPPYSTFIQVQDMGSEYTKGLNPDDFIYVGANTVPVTKLFESEKEYKTIYEVLSTYDTAVILPVDADENWEVTDDTEKGPFVTLAVSVDSRYNSEDMQSYASSVIMLSGVGVIDNSVINYNSVGNLQAVLKTIDRAVGREDNGISFDSRTVDTTTYSDRVTQSSVVVMQVIFLGLVPAAILITGAVIWIRRRRL